MSPSYRQLDIVLYTLIVIVIIYPHLLGRLYWSWAWFFFGIGLGGYYSVSFPAVGLSVPKKIRGMGYACVGFLQTVCVCLIPIVGGLIIESKNNIKSGYKYEGILFISLCLAGVILGLFIYWFGDENSFIYNDEQEIENSMSNQVQKATKTSLQTNTEDNGIN